jgi:Uncharacterized protein conserved in bacteria
MELGRRDLLEAMSLLVAGAGPPACVRAALRAPGKTLPLFYDEIERRTFRFFWETVNRENGLVPDRWPTQSFSSIAAVGFALPAYAIGATRGWCSRAEARDLTLTTLRFFWNAPQGPLRSGVTGHAGFFYHFLDIESGRRHRDTELSSVDTTILLMGALFAGQFYDRGDAAEQEIRSLSNALYERADWNFFRSDGRDLISMGWHPETGLIARSWDGFNEGCSSRSSRSVRRFTRTGRNLGPVDRAVPIFLARQRPHAPTSLRAVVRSTIQPHLDRFPRHPRRADARGRNRLFREQPARDLRQSRLVHRQPDAMGRLFGSHLGP